MSDRRRPNLFRAGSKTLVPVRALIRLGAMPFSEFKAVHVSLGGTRNSTHVWDRYVEGRERTWDGSTYIPEDGSHALIRDEGRGTRRWFAWIGSEGETFEQRAHAWLALLTDDDLYRSVSIFREWLAQDSEPGSDVWLASALTVLHDRGLDPERRPARARSRVRGPSGRRYRSRSAVPSECPGLALARD